MEGKTMTINNIDKYKAQRQWISNICDEIVRYSETIEAWTFEREHPKWRIAFWKADGTVKFYKSGSYASIRIDLQLMLYGLKN